MFITDVLVFCLESRTNHAAYERGCSWNIHYTKPVKSCQFDTSELVELLVQSAVDHLTKFRQLQEQEFALGGFIHDRIVTTDFEALYAYKCGEYQRCLQLSTHNVRMLGVITRLIHPFPEFIQLMDDNIASLRGLTLIVNMSIREDDIKHVAISQLSLLLYLMFQCQMKVHHSATSLAQTLDHVKVARRRPLCQLLTLDQLLLKLTEREIQCYLVSINNASVLTGSLRQP